jgi:hypothetical protein
MDTRPDDRPRPYDDEIAELFMLELAGRLTPDEFRTVTDGVEAEPLKLTELPVRWDDRRRVASWMIRHTAAASLAYRDIAEASDAKDFPWRKLLAGGARIVAEDLRTLFAFGLVSRPLFYGVDVVEDVDGFPLLGTVDEDGAVRWDGRLQ